MTDVAAWLASPAGWKWERNTFSDEPSESHDWIELREDTTEEEILAHITVSSVKVFENMRRIPGWSDLQWHPDQPPEHV